MGIKKVRKPSEEKKNEKRGFSIVLSIVLLGSYLFCRGEYEPTTENGLWNYFFLKTIDEVVEEEQDVTVIAPKKVSPVVAYGYDNYCFDSNITSITLDDILMGDNFSIGTTIGIFKDSPIYSLSDLNKPLKSIYAEDENLNWVILFEAFEDEDGKIVLAGSNDEIIEYKNLGYTFLGYLPINDYSDSKDAVEGLYQPEDVYRKELEDNAAVTYSASNEDIYSGGYGRF